MFWAQALVLHHQAVEIAEPIWNRKPTTNQGFQWCNVCPHPRKGEDQCPSSVEQQGSKQPMLGFLVACMASVDYIVSLDIVWTHMLTCLSHWFSDGDTVSAVGEPIRKWGLTGGSGSLERQTLRVIVGAWFQLASFSLIIVHQDIVSCCTHLSLFLPLLNGLDLLKWWDKISHFNEQLLKLLLIRCLLPAMRI